MKLIVQRNFEGTCMEAECVSTARWFLDMGRQEKILILQIQRKKTQEALYLLCLNFDMYRLQLAFSSFLPLILINQKKKKTLSRKNNFILLKLKIHVVWL